ncbi:MAG: methylcrotonoyl-CoA carboxylase, partial [Thermoanaerobaculia bacterium]|nr:methylcrotonoyl-CoA carboxylase [Thermoanaerobaculia bacterium]
MELFESQVDTSSEEFHARREAMEHLVSRLREELGRVRQGGAGRERHAEQGKMFVRDRVDALLDPG